jgi:hypothetical protein
MLKNKKVALLDIEKLCIENICNKVEKLAMYDDK